MSFGDRSPLDAYLQDVESQFEPQDVLVLSNNLQAELRQHMISSSVSMLPSFIYDLPTGQERGTYLALEVGGSNLRMALVELRGQDIVIRQIGSFPIDTGILQLKGYKFFDWIAERILEFVVVEEEKDGPLPMGIAWSFPIDQTSIESGKVLDMGKGFHCSRDLMGQDLGELITKACQRAKLNVRLAAIINDSSSVLLASAYVDPNTRLATTLGTGMNAAVHLPVAALDPSKFKSRSPLLGTFTHVVTNTELSMFGKNIFPKTRWDDTINSTHILPDYQPLEYLVAGRYIGEIVRLIIVEATQTAGLFDGVLPSSLSENPYSVDTIDLVDLYRDTSTGFAVSRNLFHLRHPSTRRPTERDLAFVLRIVRCVITRSIAYFSVGLHALTVLLQKLETNEIDHFLIACDGSIINKWPDFMETAQERLDQMFEIGYPDMKTKLKLERTPGGTAAVLGAAVAGAMANSGKVAAP